MTIKFTRASATRITAPDAPGHTLPVDDWAIGFTLIVDGDTSGAEPQYLISHGPLAAGSFNIAFTSAAHSQACSIGVFLEGSATFYGAPSNTFTAGAWQVVIANIGGSLVLRWCPTTAAAPADASAVQTLNLTAWGAAKDGPGPLTIGGRADLTGTRFSDQSLGRIFRIDGGLTNMELARLAFGEQITDLGKTPLWYLRMNDAADITDTGSQANTFTATGTLVNGGNPGFGYVAGAPASAPVFTSNPALNGTPTVGAAVGYTSGAVTGSPAPAITQQWTLDDVDIAGATAATYTPVAGDADKLLRVREIATNSQGSASATSAGVAVAAAPASVDAVTDIAAGRVFQRVAGVASVPLAGTYNVTPTTIEAQLYASDGVTVRQAWTALTGTTINANAWTGNLAANADGFNWKRMAVRFKDAGGAVLATTPVSTALWGVGELVACAGSSSAHGWFTTGQYTASPNISRFMNGVWDKFPGTNGSVVLFANGLATRTGVLVGMLACGQSGTYLSNWADSSNYVWNNFVSNVNATGGKLGGVMLSAGSNDVANNTVTSRASHLAILRQFISNTRTLTGQSSLKFMISGFNRRLSVSAVQSNYCRMAENDVGDDVNVYHAPTLDLELSGDGIHLTSAGYEACMIRNEYVFAAVMAGGAYRRGPKVTGLGFSGSTVTATLAHRGATDFTPTTGITGFTTTDASGTPVLISAVRTDATHLTLTYDRALVAPVVTQYLAGNAPEVGTPVYDNGATALPMHVETDLATTAVNSTTRTVSVTLNTDAVTKAANLTGIQVAFSTGTGPHDAGARLFGSSSETTDANGLMTFSFDSSAISAGQEGLLSVLMPDKRHYLGLVAVT